MFRLSPLKPHYLYRFIKIQREYRGKSSEKSTKFRLKYNVAQQPIKRLGNF